MQMKHIDVTFHFVKEIIEEGDLMFEKIHMKENLADMLTKVVLGANFNHYKNLLHILRLSSVELVWINYMWLNPLGRGYVGKCSSFAELT